MAAPLISAAELDIHLQQTVPVDVGALAVAGASGAVRSYCGWNVSEETRTFITEGSGWLMLTLPTLHLKTVTGMRIDGLAIDPAGVQPKAFRRGQLAWVNVFPSGSVVEVDVLHGYDDDEMPDVVRLVALTIAARIVNNPDNVRTAAVGSVTRTYAPEMTSLDYRLLDPYRLE